MQTLFTNPPVPGKNDITNDHIWVLTDAEETEEIFASLNEATVDRLAALFYDLMEDECDPDSPKSAEDVKAMIVRDVIEGEEHSGYFSQYQLKRHELNTTVDGDIVCRAPEFKAEPGAEVWEAAERIVMGCDMAYALSPIGYFTQRLDSEALKGAEWIARKLS